MDWIEFLNANKAFLGGFSIAVATVLAMMLSLMASRRQEKKNRLERHATFASAIAAELIDNSHNLIDLYLALYRAGKRRGKLDGTKHFELQAYDRLMDQIGSLGSSLSFMLVDTYGELRRLHNTLKAADSKQIIAERDEILPDIQLALIKSITSAIVMLVYADYLSGAKYQERVERKRIIWIKSTLDEFFQYVATIDKDAEITNKDIALKSAFSRRFRNPQDKQLVQDLFQSIERVQSKVKRAPLWRAQLGFTALSLKLRNTLTYFLEIEADEYDLLSENEYLEFLGQPTSALIGKH